MIDTNQFERLAKSPRDAKVVRIRSGIDMNTDHTLEEVGQQGDVTRERIRQIRSQGPAQAAPPKPGSPPLQNTKALPTFVLAGFVMFAVLIAAAVCYGLQTRSSSFSPYCNGLLATPVCLAWLHTSSLGIRSGAYPGKKCRVSRPSVEVT